jgi:hypothetical protein
MMGDFPGDTMKTLVPAALAAALLFANAAPAAAQTAAAPPPATQAKADALKLQLANRFIAAMQGDQMGEMIAQMSTAMLPESMQGASTEELARYRETMGEISSRMMPRIFEAMAPIYADIFTVEELRALVEFYESDIGRSMMTKSYEAAPRMAEAMQAVMPAIMADMAVVICERFECSAEELRELKASMQGAL